MRFIGPSSPCFLSHSQEILSFLHFHARGWGRRGAGGVARSLLPPPHPSRPFFLFASETERGAHTYLHLFIDFSFHGVSRFPASFIFWRSPFFLHFCHFLCESTLVEMKWLLVLFGEGGEVVAREGGCEGGGFPRWAKASASVKGESGSGRAGDAGGLDCGLPWRVSHLLPPCLSA